MTGRAVVADVSRQLAPVSAALMPTRAAVWLIWKSLGRRRGPARAGQAARCGAAGRPATGHGDDQHQQRAGPAKASTPRREIVAWLGPG